MAQRGNYHRPVLSLCPRSGLELPSESERSSAVRYVALTMFCRNMEVRMFGLRGVRLAGCLLLSLVVAVSGYGLLFSQANPPAANKKGPANQNQAGFRPGARANRKHVL